jgi:hypothetical protein
MITVPLFDTGNIWRYVPDGYIPAMQLFKRHYSYHQYTDNRRNDPTNRNRNLFCGPGEKHPMMTPGNDALFVWRKFIDDSGQTGINCAIFRNESTYLSSWLIEQAELVAWSIWPGERLYTTVDPTKVLSRNPGFCYLKAGWKKCGFTKVKKLLILEKEAKQS